MRKSRALRKESRRKKHITTAVEQKPMLETMPVAELELPPITESPLAAAPDRALDAAERPVQKTSFKPKARNTSGC